LEKLTIVNCTPPSEYAIAQLENLRKLTIVSYDLDGDAISKYKLEDLQLVEELTLSGFYRVVDLEPLRRLNTIVKLELYGLQCVDNIRALKQLTNLKTLVMYHFNSLESIDSLGNLKNLENLSLNYLRDVDDFSSLGNLVNMKILNLESCGISKLEPLRYMKKLTSLKIYKCNNITSVKPLKDLKGLQKLYLLRNHKIIDLDKLSKHVEINII